MSRYSQHMVQISSRMDCTVKEEVQCVTTVDDKL